MVMFTLGGERNPPAATAYVSGVSFACLAWSRSFLKVEHRSRFSSSADAYGLCMTWFTRRPKDTEAFGMHEIYVKHLACFVEPDTDALPDA